jgi:hypothetical protein
VGGLVGGLVLRGGMVGSLSIGAIGPVGTRMGAGIGTGGTVGNAPDGADTGAPVDALESGANVGDIGALTGDRSVAVGPGTGARIGAICTGADGVETGAVGMGTVGIDTGADTGAFGAGADAMGGVGIETGTRTGAVGVVAGALTGATGAVTGAMTGACTGGGSGADGVTLGQMYIPAIMALSAIAVNCMFNT